MVECLIQYKTQNYNYPNNNVQAEGIQADCQE